MKYVGDEVKKIEYSSDDGKKYVLEFIPMGDGYNITNSNDVWVIQVSSMWKHIEEFESGTEFYFSDEVGNGEGKFILLFGISFVVKAAEEEGWNFDNEKGLLFYLDDNKICVFEGETQNEGLFSDICLSL